MFKIIRDILKIPELRRRIFWTLFLLLVFSGRAFRQNWKAQGPGWRWKAWLYGMPALTGFLALAFLPLAT